MINHCVSTIREMEKYRFLRFFDISFPKQQNSVVNE